MNDCSQENLKIYTIIQKQNNKRIHMKNLKKSKSRYKLENLEYKQFKRKKYRDKMPVHKTKNNIIHPTSSTYSTQLQTYTDTHTRTHTHNIRNI